MAYTYTTSFKKRLAGKVLASPKTHTPGSRLEKRGHRYYHPETGRWLNRDPIGDAAFLAQYIRQKPREERRRILAEARGPEVYVFLHNAPVQYVDFLGLTTVDQCKSAYYTSRSNTLAQLKTAAVDCGQSFGEGAVVCLVGCGAAALLPVVGPGFAAVCIEACCGVDALISLCCLSQAMKDSWNAQKANKDAAKSCVQSASDYDSLFDDMWLISIGVSP